MKVVQICRLQMLLAAVGVGMRNHRRHLLKLLTALDDLLKSESSGL